MGNKEQKFKTQEIIEKVEKITHDTEEFLSKNTKGLTVLFGAIILAVLAYFAYDRLYKDPLEKRSFEDSVTADKYFEKDSMQLALNGKGYLGFQQLSEKYSNAAGGNLSKYKAGIASFSLGKYEEALSYFKDFKTDEESLLPIKYGAMGDCLVEIGKKEEGYLKYKEAIDRSQIEFISSFYYRKAIFLAIDLGKYDDALKMVQDMQLKIAAEDGNPEILKLEQMLKYKLDGNKK